VLSLAKPPDDDNRSFPSSSQGQQQDNEGVATTDSSSPFPLTGLFSKAGNPRQQQQSRVSVKKTNRERIDVDSFAKAALQKAEGSLELRNYLDQRKTDWDRMEELRREMDARMDRIDDIHASRKGDEYFSENPEGEDNK